MSKEKSNIRLRAEAALDFIPADIRQYDLDNKVNGYISLVEIMEMVIYLDKGKPDKSGNPEWEHLREVASLGPRIDPSLDFATQLKQYEKIKNGLAIMLAHDLFENIVDELGAMNFKELQAKIIKSKMPVLQSFVRGLKPILEKKGGLEKLDIKDIFSELFNNISAAKDNPHVKEIVESLVRLTFVKSPDHHKFTKTKQFELYQSHVDEKIVKSRDKNSAPVKMLDRLQNMCDERFTFENVEAKNEVEKISKIKTMKAQFIKKYAPGFEALEQRGFEMVMGKHASKLPLRQKLELMVTEHNYPLKYLVIRKQAVTNMGLRDLRLGYDNIKALAIKNLPDGAQQFKELCCDMAKAR